jgi:hypothetical protein
MSTASTAVQAPPAGRYAIDPRRVISHVRDQARVRARQGPRQAQSDPVELTVDGVSAERAAIVFRVDCTVDRYAHGITMMPGMAARRLSVQITARATRA